MFVLTPTRPHKYGRSALVLFYETLSSHKNDTTRSSRYRTSYTRILHVNGRWFRSEHTTWIVRNARDITMGMANDW